MASFGSWGKPAEGSIWSKLSDSWSGNTSTTNESPSVIKGSPKIQGNTGALVGLAGEKESIIDVDDLFGPDREEPKERRVSAPPPMPERQMQPRPVKQSPNSDSAEVPEWLMSKVDEYITDHFYSLEARITSMSQQMTEVANRSQDMEGKVGSIVQEIRSLIELQFAESKKGQGRDKEVSMVAEQFQELKQEVQVKNTKAIESLKLQVDEAVMNLEDTCRAVSKDIEEKLRKRDDATYRFEAELQSIKKSFTSLRMEFQKSRKAQDFKNTSTSVFILKAIDMKPEERKQCLRTLTEQEEKLRGAVTKAEGDLRQHEKEMHMPGLEGNARNSQTNS